MIAIKNIDYKKTFEVRHPVLRQGKSVESCCFDGDDLKTTLHFGLFINDRLIGVVSVFENKCSIFNQENQFQIRGMAVLKEFQKKSFGEQLILHVEDFMKQKNISLIWFNAREIAVPFYKKMGYKIVSNSFLIENIGTHFVMVKTYIKCS